MDGVSIASMLWSVYCGNRYFLETESDAPNPDPVQTSQNEEDFENEVDLSDYWLVNSSLGFTKLLSSEV